MATRGPIPPFLSSDWSDLSGCQVSLPHKHRELALAITMSIKIQKLEVKPLVYGPLMPLSQIQTRPYLAPS